MNYTVHLSLPIVSLKTALHNELKNLFPRGYEIKNKSIDARKKTDIRIVLTINAPLEIKDLPKLKKNKFLKKLLPYKSNAELCSQDTFQAPQTKKTPSPYIIGSGPAGLFCALKLLEHGITSTIIEKGDPVEIRAEKIKNFWAKGILDEKSNVQFGEGGAGTFSDGKLSTSKNNINIDYVLKLFTSWGAPKEILYESKPHIGTDMLQNVVKNIREYLLSKGCSFHFKAEVTDFHIKADRINSLTINETEEIPVHTVVLAIGNSARKTFRVLHKKGVALKQKNFAVGFRIEHPQELINEIQYGKQARHPELPPADYKLTFNKDGHGVYSFCMCPGGLVINATSEKNNIVTNGMSTFARNSGFANSAIIASVTPEILSPYDEHDVLKGIVFQEELENKTFQLGGNKYHAPIQRVTSFLNNKNDSDLIVCSFKPGTSNQKISTILPAKLNDLIKEGLLFFNTKLKGFITQEAVLIGTETRTSSPITIVRTSEGYSENIKNLFPCGEGAGYAGGIMSSALDGLHIAKKIITSLQ